MPGFGQPPWVLGGSDVHRVHRWAVIQVAGIHSPSFFYAKTLTLPEVGFEEETAPGASLDYKFPSKATFNDVELQFYDLHGMYEEIEAAYKKVWTPEGGLNAANAYMAESMFAQYDGNGEPTRIVTLVNSYVKRLSHSPLTYEASDLKTVNVTLGYSWATYD